MGEPGVEGGKGKFKVAGRTESNKIFCGDWIDGLGDAECVDGSAVKCSVEVDEAPVARYFSLAHALHVVLGDEVFHHVLDCFGTRVHDIDL